MAAAPRRPVLGKELPDIVSIQFQDGPEYQTALEVVVPVQPRTVVIAGRYSGSRGALTPAHAKEKYHLAGNTRLFPNVVAGGLDLHSIGAPTEAAVRRGIAAADEIDPERLVQLRRGCGDNDRQIKCTCGFLYLRKADSDMFHYQRTLHERVVCHHMDSPSPFTARQGNQVFDDKVRDECAVLAAGISDNPRFAVKFRVFLADLSSDASKSVVGEAFGDNGGCEWPLGFRGFRRCSGRWSFGARLPPVEAIVSRCGFCVHGCAGDNMAIARS